MTYSFLVAQTVSTGPRLVRLACFRAKSLKAMNLFCPLVVLAFVGVGEFGDRYFCD